MTAIKRTAEYWICVTLLPVNAALQTQQTGNKKGDARWRPPLMTAGAYQARTAFACATTLSTVKPKVSNSFSAGADSPKVVMPTTAPCRPVYFCQ